MKQMLYFGHFGKLLLVQTGERITCLLFMFYLIQQLNDVYQSGCKLQCKTLFDSLDLASLYL